MSETRAKNVKESEDHNAAEGEFVKVEYLGIEFEVKAGGLSLLRVLDALERNQITTALRLLVGDNGFDRFLAERPNADAEDAGKLLEIVAERAGVKN